MASFLLAIFFVISSEGIILYGARVNKVLLQEALSLGQPSNGTTRDDCIWRVENDACSKSVVRFMLYTKRSSSSENTCDEEDCAYAEDIRAEEMDLKSPAWLHSSHWNPGHETVVLVHGYGGTSDQLPVGILKYAYLQSGAYNVIVADWGHLAKIPCYVSAVHNIRSVAKCLAELFAFLRNSGVDSKRTTCVGHSLGAHVCGATSNHLTFRMHKIIGLDPAKPLIPNTSKAKLDTGDAEMVQVLHTSSNYGDAKKAGHVDIYFNGGRIQPFCVNLTDSELCGHVRSVCYLAESLFPSSIRYGTKCKRRNMLLVENTKKLIDRIGNAHFVPIGHATPFGIVGTYCVSNIDPPFCPTNTTTSGHPFCCHPKTQIIPDFLPIQPQTN